jgi:hypothetical protein
MKDKVARKKLQELALGLGYDYESLLNENYSRGRNSLDILQNIVHKMFQKQEALASALGYEFKEVEAQPSKSVAVKKESTVPLMHFKSKK